MNKKMLKLGFAALLVLSTNMQQLNAQHKEYYPDPDTAIQR